MSGCDGKYTDEDGKEAYCQCDDGDALRRRDACLECGEPATKHAPTCWLSPRGEPLRDDQRPDGYQFNLVSYARRPEQWFGVIKLPAGAELVAEGDPPCDGLPTGVSSWCGGRGWYESEDGDKYCTCPAGKRVRHADADADERTPP